MDRPPANGDYNSPPSQPPSIITVVDPSQQQPTTNVLQAQPSDWSPPLASAPPPSQGDQPVKLFVGQVPKTFEEDDLRPYLEPYGPIQELLILRHRTTRMHKGERERE